MLDGNPTLPLYQSLRLRKNNYIPFVPFCIVMHTSGERKRGEFIGGGGEGVNGKCEMMMMGDDDDEQLFTLFVQWHSEGSRITQNQLLALLLLFELNLLLTGFA